MKLIDTDVIIWHMRGNQKARDAIEEVPSFQLSVITYMELVQGMKNRHELEAFRKTIKRWQASVLYVTEFISAKALFYMEHYYLSHSLTIPDALIAATAVEHGLPLLTANDKHYKMIQELATHKFRP